MTAEASNKIKMKFHKSTFDNISEERRQKIFDVAIKEFAANGYSATNINVIAKNASISIGSLYSYFASKEDLFLAIVDDGIELIEEVIKSIDVNEDDVFSSLENILRAARDYAMEYPEINQIYLDLATQGLSSFSHKLSCKMESTMANFYKELLKNAKEKGAISKDLNESIMAFCIDNLILMYQFSFASEYYKERLKVFVGEAAIDDDELILQEIMKFIRNALKNNS